MQFAARLRDAVRSGDVTTSIRIWKSPRVKVGGRYPLAPGWVEVTSLMEISLADVTDDMARESGFANRVDLLKTAKHGSGQRVFFVRFRYAE
tara:strand:- start:522 stop:797 length:276 start_codon:yes stop_codon:yes gene_type:complete